MAALPWYDLPEVSGWVDRFWAGWRAAAGLAGLRAGSVLARDRDPYTLLDDPGLLVSQVCGYVLPGPGRGRVQVLATPRFTAPGCEGSGYRSAVVVGPGVRARSIEGLRGLRCAVNDALSHSGCNSLRCLVGPLHRGGRFFSEVLLTGAHAESVRALAEGRADVAAIDCVTWDLLSRHRPALTEGLTVVAWTGLAPAPPWITSLHTPAEERAALRRGLAIWLADPASAEVRQALLIDGFELLPGEAYRPMVEEAVRIREAGYRELPGC